MSGMIDGKQLRKAFYAFRPREILKTCRHGTVMERNVLLIYLYSLCSTMLFAMPIEILLFKEIAGDYFLAMSLYSIAYIVGAVSSVPFGILSDALGRRKLCILYALSRLISVCFYAAATSYVWLIWGAVFYGFVRGIGLSCVEALLFESTENGGKKELYYETQSRCSALRSFGLGIGSVCSGLFVFISLRAAMVATIFPMFLAFCVTILFAEPKPDHQMQTNNPFGHLWISLKLLWREKRISYFMGADALHYAFNEASFSITSAFYKMIIPVQALGVLRCVGHFASGVTSFFAHRLGHLIGISKTTFLGAVADNIVNLLATAFCNPFSLVLKTAGSASNGVYGPASCAYMQHVLSEKDRGTMLSIFSLLVCLLYSLASLLIGKVADSYGVVNALFFGYGLALLSNVLYFPAFYQNPDARFFKLPRIDRARKTQPTQSNAL